MVYFDGDFLCVDIPQKNYEMRNNLFSLLEKCATHNIYFEINKNENIVFIEKNRTVFYYLKKYNFNIDKTAKNLFPKSEKKLKLYQFQKDAVNKMIAMQSNVLLADDLGLGKTIEICGYLRKKENSFPALIICPASLKQNWSNEIQKWTNEKTYIVDGKQSHFITKEFLDRYKAIIINYDILGSEDKYEKNEELRRKEKAKEHNFYYKKKTLDVYGWCDVFANLQFNTIICDEVQYIADNDTIRARAVIKICEGEMNKKAKRIFLSGTPYETKTSQFFTALNLLDKKQFPSRYQFLFRYCDPRKNFFGWKFDGLTHADELREKINKFMIRRYKKDVLKELPEKIRQIIPLYVSEKDRKIYDDVDDDFKYDIESGKKKRKMQLGYIAKLKQCAYEAKRNAVKAWIKDFLQLNEDKKLVVFVYHRNTFDTLMQEFNKISVGINGSTKTSERQNIVDKFQKDKNIKLFISQIKAGGVGLTLTSANVTCFVEFGMTAVQHEQAEDRVHRIGQKEDIVIAYYLTLPDSIEDDIMSVLERRNRDMKNLMNNEKNATLFNNEDMTNEAILIEYKKRRKIRENFVSK